MKVSERVALYKGAIAKWGQDAQLTQVMEECSELIQAICKIKRKGVTDEKSRANLVEELADVEIMLYQLHVIIDDMGLRKEYDAISEFKHERLRKRLETQ